MLFVLFTDVSDCEGEFEVIRMYGIKANKKIFCELVKFINGTTLQKRTNIILKGNVGKKVLQIYIQYFTFITIVTARTNE